MTFLEDYEELKRSIPVPAVRMTNPQDCQHSDYTHNSKNCHYCFLVMGSENCLYCHTSGLNKDLVDCELCVYCELCYECIECMKCYTSTFLSNSTNCRDSHYCSDCIDCSNCFGCVSLTRKQYCIFNQQYTKQEYEKKMIELKQKPAKDHLEKLNEIIKKTPIAQSFQRNNVNCPYGDYLSNSKNVYWGFNTYWLENSGYVYFGGVAKDCWDMTFSGGGGSESGDPMSGNVELCYEMVGCGGCYNCAFCNYCGICTNCYYCSDVHNCSDCFGCVGLKNKKYCFLNNQLTKQEYEKIVRQTKIALGWKTPTTPPLTPRAQPDETKTSLSVGSLPKSSNLLSEQLGRPVPQLMDRPVPQWREARRS